MRRPLLLSALLCWPHTAAAQSSVDQHSGTTLSAVLTFVDYDESVPLHSETVSTDESLGFSREKVVLTGGRRDRVPGFLSIPDGPGPFPVVLLLHAGNGSKQVWWDPDGFERGAGLTESLLISGYAVFALDGEHHGERTGSGDFVPITTWYFQHEWWATFRSMVEESVTDYRRALDYLETRPELRVSGVSAVGKSMGAITGVYLAASDERVETVVSASGSLAPDWLFPITHINLAPGLADKRVLVLGGDSDELGPVEWTRSFYEVLRSREKDLRVFESGHQLPPEWVQFARCPSRCSARPRAKPVPR